MRIQSLILPLIIASAALATGCASTPPKEKVVLQVSDDNPKTWNLALNNAENIQSNIGADKVDIEIVAYGPGIGMLKKDAATAKRVDKATKEGVNIVACEVTMGKMKLTKEDMNQHIGYVPGGVVEIMERQKQGWAYVKP